MILFYFMQEQDLIEMHLLYIYSWMLLERKKYKLEIVQMKKLMTVIKSVNSDFISILLQFLVMLNQSKQDWEPLSLLLLWFVSAQQAPLPVPPNHSQTRPRLSLCCQATTTSWLVTTMQTQNCYTWSWSCKFWIFYGTFMVRSSPSHGH